MNRELPAQDLETLMQLEITDYSFIDSLDNNRAEKKVIAQQIEEHYPLAVSTGKGFIPSIYALADVAFLAENQAIVSLANPHGLSDVSRVRFIVKEDDVLDLPVISVLDDNRFIVEMDNDTANTLFVYGMEVDNFRSVDYDALSMLNISATQELVKQLLSLKEENNEVKARVSSLETSLIKINELLSDSELELLVN